MGTRGKHRRRPNLFWTLTIGLVALVVLAAGGMLLLREPQPQNTVDPNPPSVSDAATPTAPLPDIGELAPRSLVLGRVGVTAPIGVSTVPGGVLTPPNDVSTVGIWLDGATLDAGEGTTLLAGHVNMIGQGNGALFNLALMQPGDFIYTSDDTGSPTAWRVSRVVERAKADGVEESVLDGPTGPRRLAVVTCGGELTYDNGVGDYEDNIYLYADLVE
ncbi:class F sortase [Prescottella subtropica]|uniref:class F sortase n=1 Tax=Prescottella subtropica TaxID=2545757 RepID=UPI0010F8695F|nr:class F sortase [Prescottella subtropica]